MSTVLAAIGEARVSLAYNRFFQPFRRLAERGFELRTLGASLTLRHGPQGAELDPALLDGVSLVMLPPMVVSPVLPDGTRIDLVGSLCREARRRSIPIVYQIDDYLPAIAPHNPGYTTIRDSYDNVGVMIEHADAIVVSTEPLREWLEPTGKPIHVLPNTVEPDDWRRRPRRGDRVTVGWTGSSSHIDDLLMIAPALSELTRRTDCAVVLQGLTDLPFDEQRRLIRRERQGFSPAQREVAERFLELLGALDGARYEHVPFGPTEAFFTLLPELDFDVGICPLRDTEFNRYKSAIKLYEYAVTGTMTVASDVEPYADELDDTVPDDPRAWCERLERWVRDADARERETARQRDLVLATRTAAAWTDRWEELLAGIVAAGAGAAPVL